jgi:Suppressor of fused protein (SUFU)
LDYDEGKRVLTDEEVFEGERTHLDGFWPARSYEELVWMIGPIARLLPRFRVRQIAPVAPADPWVYVTVGAWEATADQAHGTEFLLLSPEENPLHVELLAMVTNLHADDRYPLEIGSVVNIGRPWMEGSTADHLLVSVPYPYGPALEQCELGDRHVRFLWLVPITASEANLVRTRGLEALERLLEQSNVDVLAPKRRSLV